MPGKYTRRNPLDKYRQQGPGDFMGRLFELALNANNPYREMARFCEEWVAAQEQEEVEEREDERLLRRQLEHKFGKLPRWASKQLAAADAATLEEWGLRLFDAQKLEEVLPKPPKTGARPKPRK